MAVEFFGHLRTKVLESAARIERGTDVSKIPVRICIPAFAESKSGGIAPEISDLFCDILKKAGWTPDCDRPVLTEPMANAIGILTGGKNVVVRHDQCVHHRAPHCQWSGNWG